LYCQLLENAVRQLKQQPSRAPLEVSVELPWAAYFPRDYVAGAKARLEAYRRLSRVRKLERLEDFRQELRGRFGPIPEPAEWLRRFAELRILATRWKVATVHLEEEEGRATGWVVLGYKSEKRIRELAEREKGQLRVVDAANALYQVGLAGLAPQALYES